MIFNQNDEFLIEKINNKLRSLTIEWWNKAGDLNLNSYSPWMCSKSSNKPQHERVFHITPQNNKLIVKQKDLEHLEEYFLSDGNLIVSSIGSTVQKGFKVDKQLVNSSDLKPYSALHFYHCRIYRKQENGHRRKNLYFY